MEHCKSSNHQNHLCQLYESDVHKSQPERYAQLVKDSKFVCKSCGRVAASEKNLCAPVSLGSWEE